MRRPFFVNLIALIIGFSTLANAALVDNGGGCVYDTDLNITWYASALEGKGTWFQKKAWAASLTVANVKGWRLPKSVDGPFPLGYAQYNTSSSEMGHLFDTELGNKAAYDVNGNRNIHYGLGNRGIFGMALKADVYWSETQYMGNPNWVGENAAAWHFNFVTGMQVPAGGIGSCYALAVHEGNVVPNCPIKDLSPITEQYAKEAENYAHSSNPPGQNPPDFLKPPYVNEALFHAFEKLEDYYLSKNILVEITVGHRPTQYQNHLWEIMDRRKGLKKLTDQAQKDACKPRKDQIDKEMCMHFFNHSYPCADDGNFVTKVNPPAVSKHAIGPDKEGSQAIDISRPTPDGIDWVAMDFGLTFPYDDEDWHVELGDSVIKRYIFRANVASPANILVTDPLGRKVGFDPSTNSVVNDLGNGATYTGPGTEPQFVDVTAPVSGQYNVTATGTGAGAYTLTLSKLDGEGHTLDTKTLSGQIVLGQKASLDMKMPSNLPLTKGWNFISLHNQPANSAAKTVLKSILPDIRIVWGWDNETQRWLKYDPAAPQNTLTTMERGKGYWIYMTNASTLEMGAWSVEPPLAVPLYKGWNLVGYTGVSGTDASSALQPIAQKWKALWTWQDGAWSAKHTKQNLLLPPITELNQGKAYWIRIDEQGGANWGQ